MSKRQVYENMIVSAGLQMKIDEMVAANLNGRGVKFDSAQGGFGYHFAEELNQIIAESMQMHYAPLGLFNHFIIETDLEEGAETYTYEMVGHKGEAREISDFTTSASNADATRSRQSYNTDVLGAEFDYSIQDIAAARLSGKPLEKDKADAARRAHDKKHNRLGFYGNGHVKGLFTLPEIPVASISVAINATSSPQAIYTALADFINSVSARTLQAERATRLCMPDAFVRHIASTNLGNGTDTTIYKYLLASVPGLKEIVSVDELAADPSDPYNTLTKDHILADNPEERSIRYKMRPFRALPVQPQMYSFMVPTISISGGMYSPHPRMNALGEINPNP